MRRPAIEQHARAVQVAIFTQSQSFCVCGPKDACGKISVCNARRKDPVYVKGKSALDDTAPFVTSSLCLLIFVIFLI
jgi:hypothetical protein